MPAACNEYQALLERYMDGELSPAMSRKLRSHLANCQPCRQKLASLQLGDSLLHEHLEQAADEVDFAAFQDQVLRAIEHETPVSAIERFRIWLQDTIYHYRAIWIASLATAAIVLLLLLPLLGERSSPLVPEQPAAPATPQTAEVENQVIIDSLEYSGKRSMIFQVSKNNTTVIWMYDFDSPSPKEPQGDEI